MLLPYLAAFTFFYYSPFWRRSEERPKKTNIKTKITYFWADRNSSCLDKIACTATCGGPQSSLSREGYFYVACFHDAVRYIFSFFFSVFSTSSSSSSSSGIFLVLFHFPFPTLPFSGIMQYRATVGRRMICLIRYNTYRTPRYGTR